MNGYSFPDFAITSKFCFGITASSSTLMIATLINDTTHASVCESFNIAASINLIVGSTYVYAIQWTVNTQPANATEGQRLEVFMNSVSETTSINFQSNTLLQDYNYTFAGTIKNNHATSGQTRSIDIQITECLHPPDFNLTGMFYLQILLLTIFSIRIDRIGYI